MIVARRLIPAKWRPIAVVLLVVCVAGVGTLGVRYHGHAQPSAVDRRIDGWARRQLAGSFITAVLHLADPPVVVGIVAAIVVVGLLRGRWDVALLAVLAPSISLALTEWVLKPLVNRRTGGGLAFPSGHESGISSIAAVLGLLLLGLAWPQVARLAAAVALLAVVALEALALVIVGYHYATDTLGGVGVGVGVVLALALLIERLPAPSSTRRDPGRHVRRGSEEAS